MQFKVYRSSAGSGKTFTLTKEYLKLALVAPEHLRYNSPYTPHYFKHILAITFTNDAAQEMKHRILKDLGEMADPKTARQNAVFQCMLDEIPKEYEDWQLAQNPDKLVDLLQKRAALVYRYLLHYYSDFSVSTIDSFTNKIARSFSKDLDLPYNYEIQLNTDEVVEQAIYQLIEDADEKKNPKLAELLVKFAYQRLDNETNWNIDNLLKDFAKHIFDESKTPLLQPLYDLTQDDFATIESQLKSYLKSFEAKLLVLANSAISIFDSNGLEKEHFYYGDYYNYIYNHTIVDKDIFEVSLTRLSKSIKEGKWLSDKGKKAAMQGVIDHYAATFEQIFYNLENLKKQEISNYLAVSQTLPNLYQLALLSEIGRRIYTILNEENATSLNTLNEKILKIVEESPVPYIYERIGEKYFHVLIDEFQDTSHVQWNNLLPLIANNLDNQRMCMVVGDAKQAIYRWRGGNADTIAGLPQLPTISEESPHKFAESTLELYFEGNTLASNRRSLSQVVEFNNNLFTWLLAAYSPDFPKLKQHYAAHAQQPAYKQKPNDREHIELLALNTENTDYEQLTAKKVIANIENLLAKGYRHGDIVLLVRTNYHATFLSAKLVEAQIPITSDESLKLVNSAKVVLLVNFISLLAQPLDPHRKAEILFFLQDYQRQKQEKTKDNLHTVLIEDEIQNIANEPDLEKFGEFIAKKFGYQLAFDNLQYLSLYEIAEELVRTFQFQTLPEDRVYLTAFLENLNNFMLRYGNNALDFMEYWQRKGSKASVSMSQSKADSKAVKIMTIHKSKGLEFPVVLLPFADWQIDSKTRQLWVDWQQNRIAPKLSLALVNYNKLLENTTFATYYQTEKEEALIDAVNMLYVALTRAKEQLYVFYKTGKTAAGKISQILQLYAEQAEKQGIETDEDGNQIYFFCDNNQPKTPEKATEPDFLHQFLSTECRDKIRIRNRDEKAEETKISIMDLHQARNKGNVLHLAFEKLNYADELPKALNALLNEGIVNEEESKVLGSKLQKILQHPDLQDFYSRKPQRRIFNERELLVKITHYSDINRIIRPDRVIIDEDTKTVIIIDYKTGEPHENHHTQISRYAQRFVEMGYQEVKKYLVYTETEQVVRNN